MFPEITSRHLITPINIYFTSQNSSSSQLTVSSEQRNSPSPPPDVKLKKKCNTRHTLKYYNTVVVTGSGSTIIL